MPVIYEDSKCGEKGDEQQLSPRHASIHDY